MIISLFFTQCFSRMLLRSGVRVVPLFRRFSSLLLSPFLCLFAYSVHTIFVQVPYADWTVLLTAAQSWLPFEGVLRQLPPTVRGLLVQLIEV